KGDDPRVRLLHHLRAPAGFLARIEALAADEAELLPDADQPGEVLARGAVGVVVVVGPANAEAVLTGFLHLGGAVAALPVFALGGEEEIAGVIDAEVG